MYFYEWFMKKESGAVVKVEKEGIDVSLNRR